MFLFYLDINIFKSVPYHCPGKGYVCGYSRVPIDKRMTVQVNCCTGENDVRCICISCLGKDFIISITYIKNMQVNKNVVTTYFRCRNIYF